MSKNYSRIAFTDTVRAIQHERGSRALYARQDARAGDASGPDALTDDEREFLAARDSFYLATVSETGWPYVQFRGGPTGFITTLDDHTLAWPDFRGNRQFVSTGNLARNDRVAVIAMDYPNRQRLKIYGRARVVLASAAPDIADRVARPDYDTPFERVFVVDVDAFDWNCPQHITPRYTVDEIEQYLAMLRQRIAALESENATLRASKK